MNIFDVVIILLILMFGVTGWKNGGIKQLVTLVGTIIVFILAYYLKDSLAEIFIKYLPFFNFKIPVGNLMSINIIFYQLLAFLILVIIFMFILRIVINVSSVINKLVNLTLILTLPNKLLGLFLGLIEGYIFAFIILSVITIPLSGNSLFMESKVRNYIVNETPILKDSLGDLNNATNSILSLDINNDQNKNNLEVINTLLEKDIISTELLDEVLESNKLKDINGIDEIIRKYKEN